MSESEELLEPYFQLMNLNGASHVYREAVRSGVLDALSSGSKGALEVAQACSTLLRPTQLLLDALAALQLVKKNGNEYALAPLAYMLLGGSYRRLGDEYWAHLPALLKTGKPLTKMDHVAESESHYQAQAAILGWMLTPAAECAAQALRPSLPHKAAILDVGAGSAIWSLTMARDIQSAAVTAVDWPSVLEVAAETAQRFALSDRLTKIAGNYHEVEFPRGRFDLVVLGNVTHLETPDGNRSLLTKARTALKPGGRVVIFDVFPGQPRGDLNRALYALGLALRTEHGHVYSVEEFEAILRDTGFDAPKLHPLEVPPFAVGMLTAAAASR
jgi:2-polyprenyl-3-methyl-5-hydroxy-6-metoxy-1,4-benzoquinol methylase